MAEVSIRVNIAGRTYPLTVESTEQPVIRKAEQAIEDNIKVFQQYYSKQDKQDLLAMAALQLAAKSVNRAESPAPEAAVDPGDADLQAQLHRLIELADGYLNT
jgi:cell division protein ZapA